MFLQYEWHVVAAPSEARQRLLARTIRSGLAELFRRSGGGIAAAEDRAACRKARPSLGEVVHDDFHCGGHRMRFAVDGACSRIPNERRRAIPPDFRARAYSVVERFALFILWIGDCAAAAARGILARRPALQTGRSVAAA